ncbi:unnamed protein product [Miscanthus lutarioriparius]|uniref:BZIP domain-containing protein n=1 Tax=Miscanthus lutarioriparius TaxID=422564 RepID=A0A811SE21_9POAL|nr:unnamed protein product [Miscanthus lutarioriparius]
MEMPGGSGAPSLARQGSVYSLTFDEFQSTLGGASKDFGSMNMDELLRNIWTAEESNAMAAAAPTTAAASVDAHARAQQQPVAPILHQGSFTLSRTLSQKTVDEVWREIVGFTGAEDAQPVAAPAPAPAPAPTPAPLPAQAQAQRQQTLGSMTLEEFLVRAGVVREDMGHQTLVLQPHAQGLFSQGNAVAPQTMQLGNGMVAGVVGQGARRRDDGGGAHDAGRAQRDGEGGGGDLSSLSPVPYPFDTALRVRKGPTVEKVVERRQRRMIKNRESAARSRARKQAYIMELEAEVAKLKDQNDELQKKQVEMLKKQKDEKYA